MQKSSSKKWNWLFLAGIAVFATGWLYQHQIPSTTPPQQQAAGQSQPTQAVAVTPTAVKKAPAPTTKELLPRRAQSPGPAIDWENPERNIDPALVQKRDDEEARLHALQHGGPALPR